MDPDELGELRRVSARIAARTDIRDIRFDLVSAERVAEQSGDRSLGYALEPSVSNGELADNHFAIAAQYDVRIFELEGEGGEQTTIAKLTVAIAALFQLDPDAGSEPFDISQVTDTEVSAYARSTGLFAVHPYAREAIARLTGELGLPALRIPVLKINSAEMSDD